MNYTKGRVMALVTGIVIIIGAGATFWYLTHNTAQPVPVLTTALQTSNTTFPTPPTDTRVTPEPTQPAAAGLTRTSNTSTSRPNSTSATPKPQTQQTARVSATIDQSSLTSTSNTAPKIQGAVSGTSAISVYIWRNVITPPQSETATFPKSVWFNSSELRTSEIVVSKGRWNAYIGNTEVAGNGFDYSVFSAGAYTVAVYDDTTGQLLATDSLTING